MLAWQARSHVELADKHAVVSRLGYGRGVHRVGEQLRVGEAAGVGEPGAHGAWHEAGDGDAGSLQLAPERVAPLVMSGQSLRCVSVGAHLTLRSK